MDIHMPEMDGYDATKVIRAREPNIGRIPIVALTADAVSDEKERCLARGMDAFVSKPINMRELQAAIDVFV